MYKSMKKIMTWWLTLAELAQGLVPANTGVMVTHVPVNAWQCTDVFLLAPFTDFLWTLVVIQVPAVNSGL